MLVEVQDTQWVEIRTKDGRLFRRFTTLYRPSDAAVVKSVSQSQEAAVELAAGGGSGQADPFNSPSMQNRRWWLGFKRGLYGWDKAYPKPFARPVQMEGEPARTIHAGTLAEAGMKSDAAAKIDAELADWLKDTDEAFAVCVARHGVIVLHKAYGKRSGRPMTVGTGSWMASGGKMFTGLAAMMAASCRRDAAPVGDGPGDARLGHGAVHRRDTVAGGREKRADGCRRNDNGDLADHPHPRLGHHPQGSHNLASGKRRGPGRRRRGDAVPLPVGRQKRTTAEAQSHRGCRRE